MILNQIHFRGKNMKRIIIVTVTCTAALMIALGLHATGTENTAEPAIKEVDGFFYCCMEFKGSYSNMEKSINEFMGEFFKQGLMPMGPPLSAYFNSPGNVKEEELKWAFGFIVPKDTAIKEPLKLIEVKKQTAAVYLHIGPYENLSKSHEKVNVFAEKQGYKTAFPVFDKYLNNPQQVKPEELKTELIVPVVKK